MRLTLESVVNQTVKPDKWVIVDDGSTDNTPNILAEYSDRYDFIEIITRVNRGHRSVGPGVIEAFYEGYNNIETIKFNYICKLDLDLILPPEYFETIISEMELTPRLGTFSGKAYYYEKGTNNLISEGCGDESSIGAAKFYRMSCFKQIGGFVKQVMWDGIDSHRCRLLGWISMSSDDEKIRFVHLRPMGSSQKGIITGRIRHGYGQYFMGTGWLYLVASVLYRLSKKPYIFGALAIFYGYLKSFILNEEKLIDPEMSKMMRRYQWHCLLKGKSKATHELNIKMADVWNPKKIKYKLPV
jgi:glycosyltransferase involved in cell wall biosynthesis